MRFAKVCVVLAAVALVVSLGAYLATAAALAAIGSDVVTDVELVDDSGNQGATSWRTETEVGDGFSVGMGLADDFIRAWLDMTGITAGHLVLAGTLGGGIVAAAVLGSRLVRRRVRTSRTA